MPVRHVLSAGVCSCGLVSRNRVILWGMRVNTIAKAHGNIRTEEARTSRRLELRRRTEEKGPTRIIA